MGGPLRLASKRAKATGSHPQPSKVVMETRIQSLLPWLRLRASLSRVRTRIPEAESPALTPSQPAVRRCRRIKLFGLDRASVAQPPIGGGSGVARGRSSGGTKSRQSANDAGFAPALPRGPRSRSPTRQRLRACGTLGERTWGGEEAACTPREARMKVGGTQLTTRALVSGC